MSGPRRALTIRLTRSEYSAIALAADCADVPRAAWMTRTLACSAAITLAPGAPEPRALASARLSVMRADGMRAEFLAEIARYAAIMLERQLTKAQTDRVARARARGRALMVRLIPAEYAALTLAADRAGVPLATWATHILTGASALTLVVAGAHVPEGMSS